MKNMKSQAAMEFLLTYGWAITVVVVAIAALAYFGVLDPGRFAPSRCSLPAGLSCLDHSVSYVDNFPFPSTNELTLSIKNNIGNAIYLDSISSPVYSTSKNLLYIGKVPNGCKTGTDCGTGSVINNIKFEDFTDSGISGVVFESGDKYELEFEFTYIHDASNLEHTVKGTITGKVN